MTKKWLYSAALGALLIAGEAFGITVHDVFSNGFFSSEHRGDSAYLSQMGARVKMKKHKEAMEDGVKKKSWVEVWTHRSADCVLKDRQSFYTAFNNLTFHRDIHHKLTSQRRSYNEKTLSDQYMDAYTVETKRGYMTDGATNTAETVYMNRLRQKQARPIGPFVIDEWFPDKMRVLGTYYGGKDTAITNVISDHEACVTRTIQHAGHINEYAGYMVNKDTSSLRTYTQYITTDTDHVYISQVITETNTNAVETNETKYYTTEYVATFNKGRCIREKEVIKEKVYSRTAPWVFDWLNSPTKTVTVVSNANSRRRVKAKDPHTR